MSAKVFEVPIRDSDGKEIERVQVDGGLLDERVRPRLLKEAVVRYQANKRVGTHETKTRSYVAGSNKKPWRQKGTGRARAGTRKSPLWRGGGIVFGPHPRDYSLGMSQKKRVRALLSALFAKFRDGEVVVVDSLKVEAPRTRYVVGVLKSLGITGRCLIGTAGHDRNLVLSTRNIPHVLIAPVKDFNALDVLTAKTILLTREGLNAVLTASRDKKAAAAVSSTVSSPVSSPLVPPEGTVVSSPLGHVSSPLGAASSPLGPPEGTVASSKLQVPASSKAEGEVNA